MNRANNGNKSSLWTSFLSIIVCILMLTTCSFAWFTTEVTGIGMIQTAKFEITAAVSCEDEKADGVGNHVEIGTGGKSITIDRGQYYTVVLTATGTAEKGYCILKMGDMEYRTAPIEQGKTLTFTMGFTGSGTMEILIRSSWGTYHGEQVISDGGQIGNLVEGAEAPADEKQVDE